MLDGNICHACDFQRKVIINLSRGTENKCKASGLLKRLNGNSWFHDLEDELKCPMNRQFFQGNMALVMQRRPKPVVDLYKHDLSKERSQACIMHICSS